jgi:hypothetical protein
MGGLVIVGISLLAVGFLVVFFAALCRESRRIRRCKITYLPDGTGLIESSAKDSFKTNRKHNQQSIGAMNRPMVDIDRNSPRMIIHPAPFER